VSFSIPGNEAERSTYLYATEPVDRHVHYRRDALFLSRLYPSRSMSVTDDRTYEPSVLSRVPDIYAASSHYHRTLSLPIGRITLEPISPPLRLRSVPLSFKKSHEIAWYSPPLLRNIFDSRPHDLKTHQTVSDSPGLS